MKTMGIYKKILNHVKNEYGVSIKTCWIADLKERHGLPVRRAWNRRGAGEYRENPCPEDKVSCIETAMKYYKMI